MLPGVTLYAGAPFTWFGHTYATDDPVDTTGWDDHAIRNLLIRAPVYSSGTSGGSTITDTGAWQASHAYAVDDVFEQAGSTYHVILAYTSGSSFGTADTSNTTVWAEAGATGATGATGAAGTGFNPTGAWQANHAYAVNDIYTNAGTTYRVKTAYTSGSSFGSTDTTNTDVWAAAGATGATGATGAAGSAGSAGAAGAGMVTWRKDGVAAVATGDERWYNDTGRTLSLHKARVSAGVAPSSGLTVDIKKNGTSIFTTPGVTVAAAAHTQAKTPDAGGTAAVTQHATNGVFATAPGTTDCVLVFSASASAPTGVCAAWTLKGSQAGGNPIYVWLGTSPDGVSTTVGNAGFSQYVIGGSTNVATYVAGGSDSGVNTKSISASIAAGGLLLAGKNGQSGVWTASGTNVVNDGASGNGGSGHVGTSTGASAGTVSITLSGSIDNPSWAGVTFVGKTATIADGDYLTYDVTAADGTAADIVVEVALT